MYCDKARVILISGKGGDGHVSFRREKYVPMADLTVETAAGAVTSYLK